MFSNKKIAFGKIKLNVSGEKSQAVTEITGSFGKFEPNKNEANIVPENIEDGEYFFYRRIMFLFLIMI